MTKLERLVTEIADLQNQVDDLTEERDEARLFANNTGWIGDQCSVCGHRFRHYASHCPRCGKAITAPWNRPATYPDLCDCERCVELRGAG